MTDVKALQAKYGPLFDLVKDPTNWKNPIDALVSYSVLDHLGATREDLEQAVIFYAGCMPKIKTMPSGFKVTAVGYYKAIGA